MIPEFPLRVRLPVPSRVPVKVVEVVLVKMGSPVTVIPDGKLIVPASMILGHVKTFPVATNKLESEELSPTFPAKMISPPFRVRLPGPSTVPLKVIEVVPVRVYILELDPWGILSGILTFGVKLKTFADMLLGQVVIEPEAREKFARATAPTGALKLEGPFKISLLGHRHLRQM